MLIGLLRFSTTVAGSIFHSVVDVDSQDCKIISGVVISQKYIVEKVKGIGANVHIEAGCRHKI